MSRERRGNELTPDREEWNYEEVFNGDDDRRFIREELEDETQEPMEASRQDRRPAPRQRPERPAPAVISTNATINLICLLAASFGLYGLFLYFADQHSVAVRRTAVQSACLFIINCVGTALLWILYVLLRSIPVAGGALGGIVWVLWLVFIGFTCVLRWRLALYAYRGQAYILPGIGGIVRRFE